MQDDNKSLLVVLADVISTRQFLESGIFEQLAKRSPMPVKAIICHGSHDPEECARRFPGVMFYTLDDISNNSQLSKIQKGRQLLDEIINRHFGYFPMAVRLNLSHGFNVDRMESGHRNYYYDSDRIGLLPKNRIFFEAMRRWYLSGFRYVHPQISRFMEEANTATVLFSNAQAPISHGILLESIRRRLPQIAYVASWDHPVGKGVIFQCFDKYITQNKIMVDALEQYHGVPPEKVSITGWPQMDWYSPDARGLDYEKLVSGWNLNPPIPVILFAGNTETNAPSEPDVFEKILRWRDENGGAKLWSAVVRPHPKDSRWRERYAAVSAHDGVYIQEESLGDMEILSTLLKNVDCVVCTGGTVLVDAIANDRPAVGIAFDDSSHGNVRKIEKNFTMFHYKPVVESGAFYVARNIEEAVSAIHRSLQSPGELRERRLAMTKRVAGKLDGKAVERVVDAVMETIKTCVTDLESRNDEP